MLIAFVCIMPVAHARLWTNTEGKGFEGDLKRVESNIAVIQRRSDLRMFRVPIKTLVEADREYVGRYQKKQRSAGLKKDEPLTFLPQDAIYTNGRSVKVSGPTTRTICWSNKDDILKFTSALPEGRYELKLKYSSGNGDYAGRKKGTLTYTVNGHSKDQKLNGTRGWLHPIEVSLGHCDHPGGSFEILLETKETYGYPALLDFYELTVE